MALMDVLVPSMLGLDRVHCAKKIYTKKKIQKNIHLIFPSISPSIIVSYLLCSILQLSVVLWFSSVGFNAHPHGLF